MGQLLRAVAYQRATSNAAAAFTNPEFVSRQIALDSDRLPIPLARWRSNDHLINPYDKTVPADRHHCQNRRHHKAEEKERPELFFFALVGVLTHCPLMLTELQ